MSHGDWAIELAAAIWLAAMVGAFTVLLVKYVI